MSLQEFFFQSASSRYIHEVKTRLPLLNEYPVIDIRSAVTDIHVNPAAAQFLPKSHQHLASPAYVEQSAVITCPEPHATAYMFTPETWRRSLTPASIPMTYGSGVYGAVIQSKGNLYTGGSYGYTYGDENRTIADPWGFFGSKEAAMEENIGNMLLDCGFPAGLVLGTCQLDPQKLTEIIELVYEKHHAWRIDILSNLKKVLNYRDVPAIMLRITDTFSRLSETTNISNLGAYEEACQHLAFFNPVLHEKLLDPALDGALMLPEQRDIDALLDGTYEIILNNANALNRAYKKYPELRTYPSLVPCLTTTKDIGHRFVAVDFEQSIDTFPNSLTLDNPKHRNTYEDYMMSRIKQYYYFILSQRYQGGNLIENIELAKKLKHALYIQTAIY